MTALDSSAPASLWQETQKWTATFRVSLRPGALRRLRRSRGFTLSGLSQASGVNRHHISRIESETDTSVYIDTARRLVKGLLGPDATDAALGETLVQLCEFEEEKAGVHD